MLCSSPERAVVVCADWVAGYHLNSRPGQPALNLRPSYRRATVAGCYLTCAGAKSARTHPICWIPQKCIFRIREIWFKESEKNLRPSYRRATVAGCYLTCAGAKSARTHPICWIPQKCIFRIREIWFKESEKYLRPSYRRATVAGCYLTQEQNLPEPIQLCAVQHSSETLVPSFGNIRRRVLNLTCHCPIAQLSRG